MRAATVDIQTPPEAKIDRAAAIAEWSNPEPQQAYLDRMPETCVPYIVRGPSALQTDLAS
jgi:hypothetical protein